MKKKNSSIMQAPDGRSLVLIPKNGILKLKILYIKGVMQNSRRTLILKTSCWVLEVQHWLRPVRLIPYGA